MKSSYKLYGSIWDRLPIPEQCPVVNTDKCNGDGITIKLSEQFVKDNLATNRLNNLIILNVDFVLKTNSVVIWNFYLKRMLQVVEYYQISIVYCSDTNYVDRLNKKLRDYYKRKTPKRLLAQSVGVFRMIC